MQFIFNYTLQREIRMLRENREGGIKAKGKILFAVLHGSKWRNRVFDSGLLI
jgi:hypothetical protein